MTTTTKNARETQEFLQDDAVIAYLNQHPTFFDKHPELLTKLEISHAANGAVSLIERQVTILREQNQSYRRQLHELIEIARNNDVLFERLQHLSLSLMDSNDPNEMLLLLQHSLQHDFQADAATLQFFAPSTAIISPLNDPGFLKIEFTENTDHISSYQKILDKGEPICGRLKPSLCEELFVDKAADIRSSALIPLADKKPFAEHSPMLGLLAIGSHQADRFDANMGTVFLKYMGELISRKLASYYVTTLEPGAP